MGTTDASRLTPAATATTTDEHGLRRDGRCGVKVEHLTELGDHMDGFDRDWRGLSWDTMQATQERVPTPGERAAGGLTDAAGAGRDGGGSGPIRL